MSSLNENLLAKWQEVLDHEDLPKIADPHRRAVTAMVLENTEQALREASVIGANQSLLTEAPTNVMGASSSTAGAGNIDIFDPVLISLVRRAMPNLIAYDLCGVQPMSGPTGLIFAMRSHTVPGATRANTDTWSETFYNEVDTSVSGTGSHSDTTGNDASVSSGTGMATASAEALGESGGTPFNEMAFTIDKVTVTAITRALKADYSLELAQDLKAVHGLDAEAELSNMLTAEILAEINREVVRKIYSTAVTGAPSTTTAGTFDLDTDSNGRWSVEKFKGLMFHLEQEANAIAKATRRGKGNLVLCSSDVASALQMAGVLDYTPALNSNSLAVDDTGNTFVGVLNGRFRVYIDPYSNNNYAVVGYKGANAFDAGLFYCPYVPLQMVRAVDQDTFQPKIGFKTRYGMVANPFARGLTVFDGSIADNQNVYYRRNLVRNIL